MMEPEVRTPSPPESPPPPNRPRHRRWLQWGIPVFGIALAMGFGVFAGVGGYTFYYGEGMSYFSADPKACANCHIMQPQLDSWQKSSHHTVAVCVDCHLPSGFAEKWIAKAENGWAHSRAFTMQDFHEPIQMTERNYEILQNNCIGCHGELANQMAPGHAEGAASVECLHCHRTVGHGASLGLGRFEIPESAREVEKEIAR